MNCARCRAAMRYDDGKYSQQVENFSCIICGHYIELIPETVVPEELKAIELKTLGKSGWLQSYIKKQLPEIKKLRADNKRWHSIIKTLSDRDGVELSLCAFTVAYRKVLSYE